MTAEGRPDGVVDDGSYADLTVIPVPPPGRMHHTGRVQSAALRCRRPLMQATAIAEAGVGRQWAAIEQAACEGVTGECRLRPK